MHAKSSWQDWYISFIKDPVGPPHVCPLVIRAWGSVACEKWPSPTWLIPYLDTSISRGDKSCKNHKNCAKSFSNYLFKDLGLVNWGKLPWSSKHVFYVTFDKNMCDDHDPIMPRMLLTGCSFKFYQILFNNFMLQCRSALH